MARFTPHHERLTLIGLAVLVLIVGLLLWWLWRQPNPPPPPGPGPGPDGALRAATFNIRNYPESERQQTAALEALARLDAPIVALQEITAPDVFDDEVARALGPDWATVYALLPPREPRSLQRRAPDDEDCRAHDRLDDAGAATCPPQNLGLLFDRRAFVLRSARVHPLIPGRGKPALEVRLSPRDGRGRDVRVFNVHLKAYDEGLEQRLAQLDALAPIVAAAVDSGDRVLLLGDFNSTRAEDRVALADFAAQTDLVWASQGLRCTEYWDPQGSDLCQASPLDHVFSEGAPRRIEALGPCRELDCEPDRCPLFYRDVSDHCPVIAEW